MHLMKHDAHVERRAGRPGEQTLTRSAVLHASLEEGDTRFGRVTRPEHARSLW